VKRGLLVRQKIYNQNPVGTGGHALNLARPPLNDLNIRKALQYLYPNKRIIETLYYNEYEPLNSYWQYGDYQNTDNKLLEFDPFKAVELIEAAGWTEKNGDGYRIKDGVELSITLQYASALSERALTIYQEELKDAGIRLELQLLTPATRWKNLQEKEYQVSSSNWGAMVYPNPRSSWHSDLATQKNNNNVTGFANEEVDALIAAYDIEYDGDKRADLVRQMDAIIYNHHPYVLQHYKPAIRIVFWNKYALPKWGAPRFGDDYDVLLFMWSDAAKTKEMEAANSDDTKTMDPGNGHNRFWQAWLKDQKAASASTESAPEPSEPANDPADQP